MKKLLFAALALLTLAACNKDNSARLNSNQPIYLNGTFDATRIATVPAPYTPEIIARYATSFSYIDAQDGSCEHTLSPTKRDLSTNRIILGDNDLAVYQDVEGTIYPGYFVNKGIHDMVLTARFLRDVPGEWVDALLPVEDQPINAERDTLGYVPNAVIRAADASIQAAFDAGDYERCVKLFEEAYVFIPITGPEWRELKARGEN